MMEPANTINKRRNKFPWEWRWDFDFCSFLLPRGSSASVNVYKLIEITSNCVHSVAVTSVNCHTVPCYGDRRALGQHVHEPHERMIHNGLRAAPMDQSNSFHRPNRDPVPGRMKMTEIKLGISTDLKEMCVCIQLLDDVLELARVVHNCYSKRRLVNFYSLVNYIHLQWREDKRLFSCDFSPLERLTLTDEAHFRFETISNMNAIREYVEWRYTARAMHSRNFNFITNAYFIHFEPSFPWCCVSSFAFRHIHSRSEICITCAARIAAHLIKHK